jgi:hypothetical protein
MKTIHKIGVVGSREYPRLEAVREFVSKLDPITNVLVTGGARGVDQTAAEEARDRNVRVVEYRPNYNKYGRGAPLRRNTEIVLGSDSLVAFWDGESTGTLDTLAKAAFGFTHRKRQVDPIPFALFGPAGTLLQANDSDGVEDLKALIKTARWSKRQRQMAVPGG